MSSLILDLITALAGMVGSVLSANGVIPAQYGSLINASIAAGTALFQSLTSGSSATTELNATLTALQAELTAVQQDTSADPVILGNISEVSLLVQAALTGGVAAQNGADPALLNVPDAVV